MRSSQLAATPLRKRSIVIIKPNHYSLEPVEQYLSQRGWMVTISDEALQSALDVVRREDPEYVFISTTVLPHEFGPAFRTLQQTYKVILFTEHASPEAIHRVQECQAPYALFSDLTGPTAERMINHISSSTKPRHAGFELPMEPAKADLERMAHATDHALREICNPAKATTKPLGSCKSFHCFVIHTARITGYYVVAASDVVDPALMRKIREHITRIMERNGQFFKTGSIQSVELREVQFEALAMNCAEFFKKSAHLDSEIAVAFFKLSQPPVRITAARDANWFTTGLNELVSGEKTEFDLYVYLPRNRKFVLFKRVGDVFDETHRTNLNERGITEIHLKHEAIPALQRYKARTYLDSLIWRFNGDSTDVTSTSG